MKGSQINTAGGRDWFPSGLLALQGFPRGKTGSSGRGGSEARTRVPVGTVPANCAKLL